MRRTLSVIICLSIALALVSCGGGGGGGSSSLYTGLTTQAVIADNNAERFVLSAYRGGEWSDSSVPLPSLEGSGGAGRVGSTHSSILGLVRNMDGIVRGAVGRSPSAALSGPSPTVYSDSGTVYGWSGSYNYSIKWDDVTGALSGSINFFSYDEDGSGYVISGPVTFSGVMPYYPYISQLTMNFRGVTVVDGVNDQTAWGTVGMTDGYPTSSTSINLYVRDNVGGETVWINNYVMAVTVDTNNTANYSVTIAGRFYLPTEGYVEVSTPVSFYFEGNAVNPSSGVLLVTGAGPTSATLTVPGPAPFDYRIEADTDGDASAEFVLDGTWT